VRTFVLLFACAVTSFPQGFHLGVKAGVPLTDFFSTVSSPNFGFNGDTKNYIIGPMVQLDLPAGLAVEFDALYRRLSYDVTATTTALQTTTHTTANAWEFPLTLKYRFRIPFARPYVEGGVAWNNLSGVKQSISSTLGLSGSSTPAELQNSTITGVVLGAGVDVHALFLHIVPGVRYTRWTSAHIRQPTGSLFESSRNQAEFLVGFTF
jgi:hypothetical protein